MTIDVGIQRQLIYKKETNWGEAPGASSAQKLRRVTMGINLEKDTYQSNEIVSHQQLSDFRHGARRVTGNINGELSPKTYADFLGSLLRRDFAAVSAISSVSATVADVSGLSSTITDAGKTFITSGLKLGMVIRLTGANVPAGDIGKNLRITALTETQITVTADGVKLTAGGPYASTTVTVAGKCTWVPSTGQTDQSYWIEDWHGGITESEQFGGCKVNTAGIALPPSGMSTIQLGFLGKDMTTASGAAYFTTPTDETTTGVCAAVNGAVRAGTTDLGVITGAQINITGDYSGAQIVGSNVTPAIFQGRFGCTGQITAYFDAVLLRDAFIAETPIALYLWAKADGAVTGDFVNFILPRVKFGGSSKDDGTKGVIQTLPFVAMYNGSGGTGQTSEKTTLLIQDSAA